MVLPVVGLVLAEILLIREEPQHVRLLRVLQIVEELGGVKQPSFCPWSPGSKAGQFAFCSFCSANPHLHIVELSFYQTQFNSHRSHELGEVNVDHGLNPFDKICISQLPAVVQRLWTSCDNSMGILTLLQLLTNTLDGSHIDP